MAEIWKPQSIEVYQGWIDTIKEEALDKLNQWEFDFIISLDLQICGNYRLPSQKQAEILERIYTEKTS